MLKIKKKSHFLFVSQSVFLGSRDVKWKRHKLMNMRYVRNGSGRQALPLTTQIDIKLFQVNACLFAINFSLLRRDEGL